MSYHLREIEKGVLGEFSKIEEEWDELLDAREQGAKVMELCEFADLLGAIESYVGNKYNLTLEDLIKMKDQTARAFASGRRK